MSNVKCEECLSENPWHHEDDCPHYRPISAEEINASLLKEPERDALRHANTSSALRAKVEKELQSRNGVAIS